MFMRDYKKKTIGILGGLGPESTGKFYLDFVEAFVKRFGPKSNQEYPHIIINSIPAPDLIKNQNSPGDIEFYVKSLKQLESWGADFIAIACNSAYAYQNIFQKEIGVPIINLPKEVEKYFKENKKKTMAIFGTKTTIDNKLYEFNSIRDIPLEKKEVAVMSDALALFNLGIKKDVQTKTLTKFYNKYSKKAEVILLSCSEAALMLNKKPKTLDTFDILIQATLREYAK